MLKNILVDCFSVPKERTALSVQLPEYAALTDREQRLATLTIVNKYLLERLVKIERFAGHMLEIPADGSIIRVYGERGIRIKRRVMYGQPAAGRHPRLGLSHRPIHEPQARVIAPGNPGITTTPQGQ